MFRIKSTKQTIFIITAIILMVTFVVLVSLVGKNLTYTTRFTPPSTQKALKNQSYFTESQVLVVGLGGLLILILPSLSYTVFLKSKRFFIPLWITYVVLASLLLLVSLYYLIGHQDYRNYLSEISSAIQNTPNYCDSSLCTKATCVRLSSFHASRKMVEAFCVIGSLGSLYIAGVGFLINLGRRKNNQIQLIM